MSAERSDDPASPRGAAVAPTAPAAAVGPTHTALRDPWSSLERFTQARIALGRSGAALPTRAVLAFEADHARARDAVMTPLDVPALQSELEGLGLRALPVRSRASSRQAYLARPDWGRRLHDECREALEACAGAHRSTQASAWSCVIVVSDGLSSTAVAKHAPQVVRELLTRLDPKQLAPIVIATQARVALGDEIGELLGARLCVHLIGERPGLSSPDSLGVYLTYDPRSNRNDAERNCISNVRPEGLAYAQAAQQITAWMRQATAAACSGVALRFDPSAAVLASHATGYSRV